VQLPPPRPIVVVDVSSLTAPDERVLEILVRLQLTARRCGAAIRLCHARAELVDLLALVGLSDVLPVVADSGYEPDRLVEQREEPLVDEEVDPGDPTV
jgi:anti-anti-sigma regulatory factor